MSNKEQHGAKGSMYLSRDWEETSGGGKEHSCDAKLEASEDGLSVILIELKGVEDFRQSLIFRKENADLRAETYQVLLHAPVVLRYAYKLGES